MSMITQDSIMPVLGSKFLFSYSHQKMSTGSKIHVVWITGISKDGTKVFINPLDFNNKALITNARRMLESQIIATVQFVTDKCGTHVLFQVSEQFVEKLSDNETTLFYKNGSVETKIAELSFCTSFNKKQYAGVMAVFKSWYAEALAKFSPST